MLEQGLGYVAPETYWEEGVLDKVSKCQSEIEKLTHSQDSKLLLRQGVKFDSGQPNQIGEPESAFLAFKILLNQKIQKSCPHRWFLITL